MTDFQEDYQKMVKEILERGLENFQYLADKYEGTVNDIDAAEKFFEDFMLKTEGDVILDMIDAANWDCIRKIEVDKQNGIVWFYWQVLDNDPEVNYMRKMAFPFDYHGLCLKFDNVRFIRDKQKQCFGICVNGYTIREKNLKRIAETDGWEIKAVNSDESFFSTSIVRVKGGVSEHWRFMTTPISSFWIIPRRIGIDAQDSEKFLYLLGTEKCEIYLKEAIDDLKHLEDFSPDKQKRMIKSAGNEMRNVAENLFKLILCFYQEEYHYKAKNYDDMLLGDLIGSLKKSIYTSQLTEQLFSDIARIANDLSHDSGNPVTLPDLSKLSIALSYFIGDFNSRIDLKGNEIEDYTKSDMPAASEYTEQHLEEFCFKDEIAEIVSKSSGKLSYTIRVDVGSGVNIFHSKPVYYLCTDGYIRLLHKDELTQALKIWDRDELIALIERIYKKVEMICQDNGYDTEYSLLGFSLDGVLKKEANPSHLFTEEEIKDLMLNANDEVNNKLVIDEEGYAQIIQNPKHGVLYPVSQETWCAGNMYVGKDSKLTDLHDSYVLSLHSWLHYLHSGCRVYDDIYVSDDNIKDVIEKITKYIDN